MGATKTRHLQAVPNDEVFRPLSADQEDAIAATLSPDAKILVADAFERALELLAGGASLQQVVTGAFHAGTLHGYDSAVEDMRRGPIA